jgi:hypothetical protein
MSEEAVFISDGIAGSMQLTSTNFRRSNGYGFVADCDYQLSTS